MDPFRIHIGTILKHEGGYVNDTADPGGETNMGISKRAFPKVDIRRLTREDAIELYRTHYWIPAKCDQVPARLQALHLDTAVNCGVAVAIRILQQAAGVTDDGVFGPMTAEAARRVELKVYGARRLQYYERLITRNPVLAKFRKGWFARVASYMPK